MRRPTTTKIEDDGEGHTFAIDVDDGYTFVIDGEVLFGVDYHTLFEEGPAFDNCLARATRSSSMSTMGRFVLVCTTAPSSGDVESRMFVV